MYYKTKQRAKLYELFEKNPHKFYSVKEIAAELTHYDISTSAIYRNLGTLVEDGLVRKSFKDNSREVLYQYANGEACRNEIHLTCSVCGKVFHVEHESAGKIRQELLKVEGFEMDTVKTMIFGICRECRKKQNAGESK